MEKPETNAYKALIAVISKLETKKHLFESKKHNIKRNILHLPIELSRSQQVFTNVKANIH